MTIKWFHCDARSGPANFGLSCHFKTFALGFDIVSYDFEGGDFAQIDERWTRRVHAGFLQRTTQSSCLNLCQTGRCRTHEFLLKTPGKMMIWSWGCMLGHPGESWKIRSDSQWVPGASQEFLPQPSYISSEPTFLTFFQLQSVNIFSSKNW